MALYGVVFAVLENDIRRLLAYHIISQVGYMVTAVGIGTAMALNGAAAHAFAHILYKGLLFMGAGAVLYSTGKSKATELGGLAKAMPGVLGLYMIGAFSISGFPLFSGFVSKSMVISAAADSHLDWAAMLLTLASVGTFLSIGLKLPYFTWMGESRGAKLERTVPIGMYVGMGLAAALCFIIGVVPSMFYELMPFPVHYHPYSAVHLVETSQLLIFTGLSFWFFIKKLSSKSTITMDTDWFYRKTGPFFTHVTAASLNGLNTLAEKWVVKGVVGKLCRFSQEGPANLAAFVCTPYWRLRFNPEQAEKEKCHLYQVMDSGTTALTIKSLGFAIYIAALLYWVV
jgi:multicomponent Na+:H+ antiporter subunit D